VRRYDRIYEWLLLVVTVLPAIVRIFRPADLAQISWKRYEQGMGRKRYLLVGIGYLLLAFGVLPLYYLYWRQQRWVLLAFIYSLVSAGEFILNARAGSIATLTSQNRVFGAFYAVIGIATALLLFRS
jgi:hypothetical protein